MAIITISRLVGSLGDEIAQALAQKLAYRLIGHQDFQRAAAAHEPDLAAHLERLMGEEGPGFFERFFFGNPAYHSLYQALVLELAAPRQVIILGRGAQIVLRDIPQAVRVRVVAPAHRRVLHLCGMHGMDADQALEFVRRHDHRREALIRQIYDSDPDHWRLYDLVLNTERLDLEAGVETISALTQQVKRLYPQEDPTPRLLALALGKRVEARLRLAASACREVVVSGEPDGTMTLGGSVPSQRALQQAEQLVASQPGVTRVVNKLKYSVFGYGG